MRPLFRRKQSDQKLFVTACMFGFMTVLIALAVNYMGSPSPAPQQGKITHVATHQSVTRDSQSDIVAFAYASQQVGDTVNANAAGNSLTQLIPQVRKALGDSAAALTQSLTGLPDHEIVSVDNGETLNGILAAFEVPQELALSAIESMKDVFSPRALRAGQKITLMFRPTENGSREFTGYRFSPDPLRDIVVLDEKGTGQFSSKIIEKDLRKVIVAKQGNIVGSLSGATARAGVPQSILSQMIKAYSFSVDFQRDIKEGDKFEVLYHAEIDEKGRAYRTGDMLFARLTLRDKEDTVYLYKNAHGHSEYFKADGHSVRRSLLKTPIDGVRVTSGFGMRRHPILGYSKRHNGIDFGARPGTPIYAAGDGTVVRSSWFGAYGNYVKIRHSNGIETAYAHMSRYAKGLRVGSRVKQGQVIGYVGTTGRSTGPHLHYEVHMHGRQVNPLGIKVPMGTQLAGKELHKFKLQIGSLESQYKTATRQGPLNVASR
jgi:murein DD-endopeptidase MepM/ murein hydrolase activator NlpD